MVSGEIRDFQISYSSDTDDNTYDQGRLLLPGPGWCASTADDKPFFQVIEVLLLRCAFNEPYLKRNEHRSPG